VPGPWCRDWSPPGRAVWGATWARASGFAWSTTCGSASTVTSSSLPLAFFARAQSGAIQSRINNDVIDAQALTQNVFGSLASNLLALVVATGAMWALSPAVTAIALGATPLLLWPARHFGPGLGRSANRQAIESALMNSLVAERFNVQGALLFTMAGRDEIDRAAFEARAMALREAVVQRNLVFQRAAFFFAAMASLAYGAVYLYGGWRSARGDLSIGTVVALAGLAGVAYGPIQSFAQGGINLSPGLVAFRRVYEVLDFPPAVAEPAQPLALPRPVSGVAFARVSFTHPSAETAAPESLRSPTAGLLSEGQRVLHDLSFEAAPGQMTALVGPTGAGKTTITLLVPRLYDPDEGVVSLGGVDVRDLSLTELRRSVGMVTQDAYLLNDTLAANLRVVHPDASDAECAQALERASLGSLMTALPDGLATVVGDRGYRLSGGEKQRVALARVFLSDPAVIVLDEATAHLDTQTETAIQAALEESRSGRTLIVVAHRLSTVRHADQILVVDKGRIAERGVHRDLLDRGELYPKLYAAGLEMGARGMDDR
jgi:ATP-binding cassette, subfamily B, bacterial